MPDNVLVPLYHKVSPVAQSDSGIRTRRSELRDKGLVIDTGQRVLLATGRQAAVWAATQTSAASAGEQR